MAIFSNLASLPFWVGVAIIALLVVLGYEFFIAPMLAGMFPAYKTQLEA